ncbi:MAG: hypothetical protein ATN35_04960 [Epulopiscium sp. Nele67-Bin004]|nr:MAG: hypothetical protein ATN35_04960 [Epulopiscium sp. Nele67-Bin004]
MKIDNRGITYIELMATSVLVTSILCVFLINITKNTHIFANVQNTDELVKSANEIINIISSTKNLDNIKDLYLENFDYIIAVYDVTGEPDKITNEHLSCSYFDTTNNKFSSTDIEKIFQNNTFAVGGTLKIVNQFIVLNVSHKDADVESGVRYIAMY